MLLTKSFIEYLQYERNYSDLTVKVYEADVLELQHFIETQAGDLEPSEVEVSLIREWVVALMEKERKTSTVNRKLSSLRAYFKFLLKRGEIVVDPMYKIVGPKKEKALPVFVKEKDMNRLLDEIYFEEGFEGCRDHLILEMFYATGMRLAELVGLKEVDVDLTSSLLKVTGKRNKQRLIPFGESLKQKIEEYVNQRNRAVRQKSDVFFVQTDGTPITRYVVTKVVKRNLSKVVTLKKRSPHVLRHTFATAMLNHEAELGAIKEILGHESLATTEIYTHTTFEELKKVYNQAHPRA